MTSIATNSFDTLLFIAASIHCRGKEKHYVSYGKEGIELKEKTQSDIGHLVKLIAETFKESPNYSEPQKRELYTAYRTIRLRLEEKSKPFGIFAAIFCFSLINVQKTLKRHENELKLSLKQKEATPAALLLKESGKGTHAAPSKEEWSYRLNVARTVWNKLQATAAPQTYFATLPSKILSHPSKRLSANGLLKQELTHIPAPKLKIAPLPGLDAHPITVGGQRYIASAMPKEPGIASFWKMIFEQRSNIVVKLAGNNVYWPRKSGEARDLGNGLKIELQAETLLCLGITKRTLLLTSEKGSHTVSHFEFNGWPDFGVPQKEKMALLLAEIDKESTTPDSPLTVHCMGGIGRTGTFIGIHATKKNPALNPKFAVIDMRIQRPKPMVETLEQFVLIHEMQSFHLPSQQN